MVIRNSFLRYTFVFISEAQFLAPSHKIQHYAKSPLNSYERANPIGKPLRGRLSCSQLAVTLILVKNPDKSIKDGQKWCEGGSHQPVEGAVPRGAHLPAFPCKPLWDFALIFPAIPRSCAVRTECPVVARPSLSYCCNYSPTVDSKILHSWIQGICFKALSAQRQLAGDQKNEVFAIKL